MHNGSRKYHLAKTFSWRIMASLTTFGLAWLITGDLGIGITISISEAILKMIFYYGHERVWHAFSHGKV